MRYCDHDLEPITIPHDELLGMVQSMTGPISHLRVGAPDARGAFRWTATRCVSRAPVSGSFAMNLAPADSGIAMTLLATVAGAS
jgi:hypothetical protein